MLGGVIFFLIAAITLKEVIKVVRGDRNKKKRHHMHEFGVQLEMTREDGKRILRTDYGWPCCPHDLILVDKDPYAKEPEDAEAESVQGSGPGQSVEGGLRQGESDSQPERSEDADNVGQRF